MPHVIVKMLAGRTAAQKQAVADAVTQAVMTTLDQEADAVSVGIEDVAADDWMAKVYAPDITAKPDQLVKKPGYGPAQA